jgi:hypothetical protein
MLSRLVTSNQLAFVAFHYGITDVSALTILKAIADTIAIMSTIVCFVGGGCMLILFLVYSVLLLFKRVQDRTKTAFLGIGSLLMIFLSVNNKYQVVEAVGDLIPIAHPKLYMELYKANSTLAPVSVPAKPSTREFATLNFLAGNYYHGDGFGENRYFNIKPDETYDFKWLGCCGTYAADNGTAEIKNGYLTITANNTSEGSAPWGKEIQLHKVDQLVLVNFIPIIWGGRTYLVKPGEMIEFCIMVNEGGEPRNCAHGFYYLRRDDWQKRTSGLPNLPPPWNKLRFKNSLKT